MCAKCKRFDVKYKELKNFIEFILNNLDVFLKKDLQIIETYSIFVRINYRKTIFSTIYQKNPEMGCNN